MRVICEIHWISRKTNRETGRRVGDIRIERGGCFKAIHDLEGSRSESIWSSRHVANAAAWRRCLAPRRWPPAWSWNFILLRALLRIPIPLIWYPRNHRFVICWPHSGYSILTITWYKVLYIFNTVKFWKR